MPQQPESSSLISRPGIRLQGGQRARGPQHRLLLAVAVQQDAACAAV